MSKKDWRLLESYKATCLTPEQIIKLKEAQIEGTDNRAHPELKTERSGVR